MDWEVPGEPADLVQGEVSWGSGEIHGRLGAFTPVSGIAQGRVFKAGLSGLMRGRLGYTVRAVRSVSLLGEVRGFWRTDLETFTDGELGVGSSRYVGAEAYGRAVWAPQSALRFLAGGGVFIPGGAFRSDAGLRWEGSVEMTVSF
jgi:hypothetical protein